MIHKTFLTRPEGTIVRVTFTLPASLQADRIFLVGDFNDWNTTSHPFARDAEGNWIFVLELEPGRAYQFRYWSDGQWLNDGDADAYVINRYGTDNFVVITDPLFRRHDDGG